MVEMRYTPILKWKKAERDALIDLTDEQKPHVLPLFEIIRPPKLSATAKKKGIISQEDELLFVKSVSIPSEILSSWGDSRSFFADLTLIFPESLRTNFATIFYDNINKLHLKPIPVLNLLTDGNDYSKTIIEIMKKNSYNRICFRINVAEIVKENIESINTAIANFIRENSFDKQNISLLLDLKENTDSTVFKDSVTNLQSIILLNDFANVIVANGAFPKDMSPFKIDEADNHQIRDDWVNWKSLENAGLKRIPAFSDYTIRHPVYDESVINYQSTATIKYTVSDRWNIYKGAQGEFSNYLANASILRNSSDFYGAEFSAGDKYIDEKGLYFTEYISNPNKRGAGSTGQWLCSGINHHIAVVLDQLANLND